jgi:O-antigen ligase/tetratricopeptide (TPR) repeat protein
LLGLVTALIVARPLVLGEDPGLTDHLSGAGGLVITLLWLVAAVGWAVWRAWSQQAGWRGSAVEAALLAVVILVLVSAIGAASYKHPAWLIASEWFVILVAFCLIRQLAVTPGDNHCLLAVLLATGVSLSVHGVYQYAVELPDQRQLVEKPAQLVQTLAQTGNYVDANNPLLEHFKQRLQADNIFATFVNPNSFAGFLALLFPLAVGWAVASKMGQSWNLKIGLAIGSAGIMAAALWFTHSRGAILATFLVGMSIGGIYWRQIVWTHRWKCLAAAAVIAGLICIPFARGWVTTSGLEKTQISTNKRLDYWSATWPMIKDHPWLGVGPGQFGQFYPRYMRETAYEKITNPHNFVLEIWATYGLFALAALGAALVAFFWRARSDWTQRGSIPANDELRATLRLEFLLGGMFGLSLGWFLWAYDLTGENWADQMIYGTFKAGMRSLVWFGCFALFESIPWPGPTRAIALTAGFAALLLNLLVSDGISLPSVAQPLWIVAALALNTLPQAAATIKPRNWLGVMAPIPVLSAICLGYFVFLFDPTLTSVDSMRKARLLYPLYWEKQEALGDQKRVPDQQKVQSEVTFLLGRITKTLETAAYGDPRQRQKPFRAEPLVELAQWYAEEWKYSMKRGEPLIQIRRKAANAAEAAIDLDPEGLEGYRVKYQLNLTFAKGSVTETKKLYELASEAMATLVRRDPTEAGNHFRWAEVLFQLGDQEAGKKQAEEALRLDRLSADPARKLRDSQRWQMLAELDPDNVSVRYQLTEALYLERDREHREQGRREAEKTLQLHQQANNPNNALTDSQRRNLELWLRPPSSN